MKPYFNKITILGVGLIGASFAMAMKKHGLCRHVAGYGRKKANLIRAKQRGIIDSYSLDPEEACKDADLVVLATPPSLFITLIKKIKPALKKGSIVIDVGSVKGFISKLEALMPEGVSFVGCHPIAGSDRSGIDMARGDLFKNAPLIITKTNKTNNYTLKKIKALWRSIGSRLIIMGPSEHDRVYALISHMPHLIAYALVNTVADIDKSSLKFSGQGFKDTTRIAGSPPELWADILMLNRGNVLKFTDAFKNSINRLSSCLKKGDRDSLMKKLLKAQKLREILKNEKG
ncbi:MAG: prephenate dehydrogenase [Nitrospirae bacterium]|nr:prephenate dehydrogenase [Nitrospirota bacterium]